MSRPFILVAVVVLLATLAPAQITLTVPVPFSTPAFAVSAASNGDTVLVSPGTYPGIVDYFGKSVNVVSTDGPEVTILVASTSFVAPVCFISQEGSGAILDGFTVTGGATATNGGGINIGFNASPTVRNCILTQNTTFAAGGAIGCAAGSSPTIVNCIITGNTSQTGRGGAVYGGPANGGTPPAALTLLNCTITGNMAVTGNPSTDTGGVFCDVGASCTLDGSIIWGNTDLETNGTAPYTASYCLIEGGNGAGGPFPGTLNFDANPLFVDSAAGDYTPDVGSPVIDAGNPAATLPPTDCTGSARIINQIVDCGAEEFLKLFPGSDTDLEVRTAVNGAPDQNPIKTATSADAYIVQFLSPNGTFDGTIPILMAQAFVTGSQPAPFAMFPELHVDPLLPILALFNGTSVPPFGFGLLPVGGMTFAYTVPGGQSGMSVQIQGLVLAPNPNNPFFTASTSHRLQIL